MFSAKQKLRKLLGLKALTENKLRCCGQYHSSQAQSCVAEPKSLRRVQGGLAEAGLQQPQYPTLSTVALGSWADMS